MSDLKAPYTCDDCNYTTETLGSANPKDLVGAKKPDLTLLSPAGLLHEALVMANGRDKYGAFNWRTKKISLTAYLAAILRHTYAYLDGEDAAADSKLLHIAHIKGTAGILIDAIETGNLIDDRPKPGAFADLVEKHTKK